MRVFLKCCASEFFPKHTERFCVAICGHKGQVRFRVRRVLERHRRHLETPGPGKSQICQGIQANQMHLAPEELLRLIELVVICQIPGWTFLLGYFLAKR